MDDLSQCLHFSALGMGAAGGPGFLGIKLWSLSLDQNPALLDNSIRTKQEGSIGSF